MPASTLTTFDDLSLQLGKAVHNFTTHTIKVALSNTAPNAATNTVLADITQIASGGGYTNGAGGGYTLAGVTYTVAAGVSTLTHTDHVITAAGGSVGPFRYAVYYNDTPAAPADPLIGWVDYGAALTLQDTETLALDQTTGILTVTA